MEEIRQNGKIILHSDDGISIKMIFKNLTGKNFQGQKYAGKHSASCVFFSPLFLPTFVASLQS